MLLWNLWWRAARDAAYVRHYLLVSAFYAAGAARDAEIAAHNKFVDFMYSGVLPSK